ncbi:PBP1A family penicillin-binding protein [Candidatus Aerophobetes bacterium]|nr:PBP1A family penicillin-binding protein [Candidatus Aerophobetes bacterium]
MTTNRKLTFYLIFLVSIFSLAGIGTGYIAATISRLPKVEQLENYQPSQITTVYSDSGETLAEFFVERREIVSLTRIPLFLRKAFIATEDRRFYSHPGIDIIRMIKAIWIDLITWRRAQGASTITQQLARNLFLTQERTLSRKLKEIILAIEIERKYSKDEILEMYLNQIYFGHSVYGVAEAASFYFDKPVEKLTLTECALLAGIPRSPGNYSPFYNPKNALIRRNYVLRRMYEAGFITYEQMKKAQQSPLGVIKADKRKEEKRHIYKAPYFVEWVRQIVAKKYGYETLWRGGLKIYTTLDVRMQDAAEKALLPYLKENNFQGALVAMDPHTGFIKAMIGGRDFEESQFNRATQAHRQTGSAFKLFTYTAAIDSGKFNAVSTFFDGPVIFYKGRRLPRSGEIKEGTRFWSPQNYEKHYWGKVYLWEMLAHSINVSSVKLLQKVGINTVIRYARKMGIESPLNPDLTLTLGTSGVTLLEMVRAYATIDNYGIKMTPIFIKKIEDSKGEILEENFPQGETVLSPQTSFLMIDLLRKAVDMGTGKRVRWLGFKRPCGGKTGTVGWTGKKDTDKTMDAWFIGFTPDLVAGVWIGNDDGSPLGEKITGSVAAIPVWTKFMKESLKGKPVKDFPCPPGIVFKSIDLDTGLVASPTCKNTQWFAFLKKNVPSQISSQSKEKDKFIVKEFNPSRFSSFWL